MKAAVAAAAAGVPPFHLSVPRASGRVIGANDRLRVGVCGLRNRGGYHLKAFLDQKNVEVTTLIDIDESQFHSSQRLLRERTGREAPRIFDDIRWALDDPDLDAVSIATCNHTHALYAIFACQAGKDVYVETPISHNLAEGRKVIAAARHYRRIVQHGSQLRASRTQAAVMDAIRSGRYGKLKTAKAINTRPFLFAPLSRPQKPPPEINWDVWTGPAPHQPFRYSLLRNNWRHYWDFGNGTIGDSGFHQLDLARWAVSQEGVPSAVWSLGGRFGQPSPLEAPNLFLAGFDFDGVTILFESRNPTGRAPTAFPEAANEFYTTEGVIRGGHFFPAGSETGEPLAWEGADGDPAQRDPFSLFISTVRNRDSAPGPASPEIAHQSCALVHLANTAYRMAQPASFLSGLPSGIGNNPLAGQSFDAIGKEMSSQGFNPATTQYQLSPVLNIDPKTEEFTGTHSRRANQMLSGPYREPWQIPALG